MTGETKPASAIVKSITEYAFLDAANAWVTGRTSRAAILTHQRRGEFLCMVFDITWRLQESSFWGFLRLAASSLHLR